MSPIGYDPERLPAMLTRLKLTAVRDRLDSLLDAAARGELNLREALALLCEAEIAHKDRRRIRMGLSIGKFPFVRTLEGFDSDAQPAVDAPLGPVGKITAGRFRHVLDTTRPRSR